MVPWGLKQASAAAIRRAKNDGNIYQPLHYEDEALLWVGGKHRRPNADEWEELFGLPRRWTDVPGLPSDPEKRELVRLRLLGNAWHVPCARLLLLSLMAYLTVPCDTVLYDALVVRSVDKADLQPAHVLWGHTGEEFTKRYLECVQTPLGPLALECRDLFDAPDTCEVL